MFVKLTESKGHHYAQLVQSYRDANGQPRQRNLMNLGRIDEHGGPFERLLQSLLKARGLSPTAATAPQVRFESALSLGDVWALDQLWREIGFHNLAPEFDTKRCKWLICIEATLSAATTARTFER